MNLTGNMIMDGLEVCSSCGGYAQSNPCGTCVDNRLLKAINQAKEEARIRDLVPQELLPLYNKWYVLQTGRPTDTPEQIIGLIQRIGSLEEQLSLTKARNDTLEKEMQELYSHRLNNDPNKVGWHSARTVGHLRMQLETIDVSTPIASVYFVKIGNKVVARTTGVQLSWERINNETNKVESENKNLPKDLAFWTHEEYAYGKEMLAYTGREEKLAIARGLAPVA